jgi:hypothetical protein
LWSGFVERQIERQHVHAGLAEEAESTTFYVLVDQLAHAVVGTSQRLPPELMPPSSCFERGVRLVPNLSAFMRKPVRPSRLFYGQ